MDVIDGNINWNWNLNWKEDKVGNIIPLMLYCLMGSLVIYCVIIATDHLLYFVEAMGDITNFLMTPSSPSGRSLLTSP